MGAVPPATPPPRTTRQEREAQGTTLPPRQRFALARAATASSLRTGDLATAYVRSVADTGLGAKPSPAPAVPAPVMAPPDTGSAPIGLHGVDQTVSIDAFPDDSSLTFGPELTVGYAPNRAGECGFFRTLSGACFSRSRRQTLPSVYRYAPAAIWALLGVLTTVSPSQLTDLVAKPTGLSPQLAYACANGVAILETLLAIIITTVFARTRPKVVAASAAVLLVAVTLLGSESTRACGCFGTPTVATRLREHCFVWALMPLAFRATRTHVARMDLKESANAA